MLSYFFQEVKYVNENISFSWLLLVIISFQLGFIENEPNIAEYPEQTKKEKIRQAEKNCRVAAIQFNKLLNGEIGSYLYI